MNTARSGSGPIPSSARSASKLAIWRPKALRRQLDVDEPEVLAVAEDHPGAGAEHGAARRRRGRGSPARARRARSPWRSSSTRRRGSPARRGRRAPRACAPRPPRRRALAASARGPRSRPGWRARRRAGAGRCPRRRTPGPLRTRAAAAARPGRRARRCRRRASRRRGPWTRPRPARGRRSGSSPRRSPAPSAPGRRT